MKNLLEKSIQLLGWHGGTIHQVLESVKEMDITSRNKFIKQLRDFAAKSNETDIFYNFVENYLKKNKGKTSFKIMLTDFPQRLKISLVTTGTGIELNDDLILFLESNVQFDYQVTTI